MTAPTGEVAAPRDRPEGARQIGGEKALIVNVEPDWCFADEERTELVAFNIVATFADEQRPHTNVRMTYLPTITRNSRVSTVAGDEAGLGGGLRSGVTRGWCRPVDGSAGVLINGERAVRHDDVYWMNCAGPEGPGNCLGEVVYVVQAAGGHVHDTRTGEEVIIGLDLRLPVLRVETAAEASWLYEALSSRPVVFTLGALQVLGGASEVMLGVQIAGAVELSSGGLGTLWAAAALVLISGHGVSTMIGGWQTMTTLTPTASPAAEGMAWGLEQAGYEPERARTVSGLLDGAWGLGNSLFGPKLLMQAPGLVPGPGPGGLVDELRPGPGPSLVDDLVDDASPLGGPAASTPAPAEGLAGTVWDRADEGNPFLSQGPALPLAYHEGAPLYTAEDVSKALGQAPPNGGAAAKSVPDYRGLKVVQDAKGFVRLVPDEQGQLPTIYRGDMRKPDAIFREGFQPWDPSAEQTLDTLQKHVHSAYKPPHRSSPPPWKRRWPRGSGPRWGKAASTSSSPLPASSTDSRSSSNGPSRCASPRPRS